MEAKICNVCAKPSRTKCGRCKVVRYCSKECQTAQWGDHRPHCMGVRELRKENDKIRELMLICVTKAHEIQMMVTANDNVRVMHSPLLRNEYNEIISNDPNDERARHTSSCLMSWAEFVQNYPRMKVYRNEVLNGISCGMIIWRDGAQSMLPLWASV